MELGCTIMQHIYNIHTCTILSTRRICLNHKLDMHLAGAGKDRQDVAGISTTQHDMRDDVRRDHKDQ